MGLRPSQGPARIRRTVSEIKGVSYFLDPINEATLCGKPGSHPKLL